MALNPNSNLRRPRRPIYTSSLEGGLLATDLRVASDLRQDFEEVFYQYEARPVMPMHMHAQLPEGLADKQFFPHTDGRSLLASLPFRLQMYYGSVLIQI